jgi:2-C-methyl-D-erythritol 4-phosphate cytidylyltransferase
LSDLKKYAIIAAGGSGMRMGNAVPKQFLLVRGRAVLWYSLNVFLEAFEDLEIILVLPAGYIETGQSIVDSTRAPGRIHAIQGGATRFHSVRNGLDQVNQPSIIFVHDAVRCLLTTTLIHRCYEIAIEKGNAIPATSPVDSMRMETNAGFLPIDRSKLRIIQTPQTFHSDLIKRAYQQDFLDSFTDDASVVEKLGVPIHLAAGEDENIKVTRPFDLLFMEKIMDFRGAN